MTITYVLKEKLIKVGTLSIYYNCKINATISQEIFHFINLWNISTIFLSSIIYLVTIIYLSSACQLFYISTHLSSVIVVHTYRYVFVYNEWNSFFQ